MIRQESGFYYLKSRYYDPAICRFINADGLASTGQGFLGCNMFAYCLNNPVNGVDPFGVESVAIRINETIPIGGPIHIKSLEELVEGFLAAFGILSTSATLVESVQINSISTTRDESKELAETRSRRQYNYWKAYLVHSQVVITTPLTLNEARIWVSLGNSVMCKNEASARVIIWLNGYCNYVGPEIHGDCGYFPHFHPTRNHTGYGSVHIWFFSKGGE